MGEGYRTYSKQVEQSTFSDMVLSEDKKSVVAVSESGQVTMMDVKTGKVLKDPKPLNLDNIYKVDYKNGNIITAGQDRRVGVYPKNGTPYYLKSDFLIYCAALSPSGKIGVYSANEKNDLQLFKVNGGVKTHILVGQDSVPSTIKFFNEDGFFSAGYGYSIYYWYLKDYNGSK
jgi:WD40 repeat protein